MKLTDKRLREMVRCVLKETSYADSYDAGEYLGGGVSEPDSSCENCVDMARQIRRAANVLEKFLDDSDGYGTVSDSYHAINQTLDLLNDA